MTQRKNIIFIIACILVAVLLWFFYPKQAPQENVTEPQQSVKTEEQEKKSVFDAKQSQLNEDEVLIDEHQLVSLTRVGEASDDIKEEFKRAPRISPDGQYEVVIASNTEEGQTNYIADREGNDITDAHNGFIRQWTPDSKKFFLYTGGSEQIYYLGIDGDYQNAGLPDGTADAAVSPKDQSMVYVLQRPQGTNKSHLYVRTPLGEDKLLLEGDDEIFAHVRWSPTGDKIAFLRSDLGLNKETQFIFTINPDGTGLTQVSQASWIPFKWSDDGKKITFINEDRVWEYEK